MTISDIRRATARLMATKVGGMAEFARKTGMSNSHISQLLGENPTKNIGDKIARRFEASFDYPVGWLDVAHVPEDLAKLEGVKPKSVENIASARVEPTGLTNEFNIDPIEIQIINGFRRASAHGKLSILAAIKAAENA